ncbi:hypothetical protein [Pleomorphovibrio marinus]|uniref:hypothetical protein n=1 Tax=Pleomorphovibrio marinus TaxID=2164132 RepID=UPI000E0B84F5|nr:hypothetical protein [Pleomorphovibrio marinus]
MKNICIKFEHLVLSLLVLVSTACVVTDDLATPNVASPVLVLLQGTEFEASSDVSVVGRFYELDKSGILDQNVGIDSIPVSGLNVRVFINSTQEVGSLTTDGSGSVLFQQTWNGLGVEAPSSGSQIRLEFAGVHNNTAFRMYHNVRVR